MNLSSVENNKDSNQNGQMKNEQREKDMMI